MSIDRWIVGCLWFVAHADAAAVLPAPAGPVSNTTWRGSNGRAPFPQLAIAGLADVASLGFVASSLIALAVLMSVVIILAVIAGVWYEGWSPARWMIVLGLLLAPASELTAYLFAASMGVLRLSTVPLTTGIVAQIFGLRFMATLFGFVFLSHQVGSFLEYGWAGCSTTAQAPTMRCGRRVSASDFSPL